MATQPQPTDDWLEEKESWYATHEALEKTLQAFFTPDEPVELRYVTKSGAGSGVYTNHQKFINDACIVSNDPQTEAVWFNLNEIRAGLASNTHRIGATAIKNENIVRRKLILIDVEAKKPKEFKQDSATDEEKREANAEAQKVGAVLTKFGIPYVMADSGNGFHLLLRVDLPCNDETDALVCNFLLSLQQQVPTAKIDVAVHNRGRVTKLYGTQTRKGRNLADRPWRVSALLEDGGGGSVSADRLRSVITAVPSAADRLAQPTKPARSDSSSRCAMKGKKHAPLTTDDVLAVLHGVKRDGSGWLARCPVLGHGRGRGDRTPSLSVNDENQKPLYHCFGGCSQEDVTQRLKELISERSWLSGQPSRSTVDSNHGVEEVVDTNHAVEQRQPACEFTLEQVTKWEKALEASVEAQHWLKNERFISMDTARLLRLGFKPNQYFRGKGCGGNCPRCGEHPAIVIPLIWSGKIAGMRYRAFAPPDANHKWAMERGSSTKVFQYSDIEANCLSDTLLVFEGPLDAAAAIDLGFSAAAICSTSSVPRTLDSWPLFHQGIEKARSRYKHIVLIGDQTDDGRAAMEKLGGLIGPGSYRFPLLSAAKDITEAIRINGAERVRENLDLAIKAAEQHRPVPQHETPSEIFTRLSREWLHLYSNTSKADVRLTETLDELEKLRTEKTIGYPQFPYHVMEGTSLFHGLVEPIVATSAKLPEFLWMPAVALYLVFLSNRVFIEGRTKTAYSMLLHLIGEKRSSHKSSSGELGQDYMEHADAAMNYSTTLTAGESDNVLIQTAGSLEGLGLRMKEIKVSRALLFYDELVKLASKACIDGSSITADLLTIADSGLWANQVKRKNESFSYAPHSYCVSLITCCPTDAFQENWARFSGSSMSGLNDRSFFLLEPECKKEQCRPRDINFAESAKETRRRIDAAIARGTYSTTPEAEDFLDAAVKRLGVHCTNLLEQMSLFFAVDLGRGARDLDCAERAAALAEYRNAAADYIKPIDADNKLAALQLRMIQTLERAPLDAQGRHRMRERELFKKLHGERYGTEMWQRALWGLLNETPPRLIRSKEQPFELWLAD